MTSLLRLSFAGLLALGAAGCTDDMDRNPAAGPGCSSPGCAGHGTNPSGGTGGNGEGGSGSEGVSDVQGTVRLMSDVAFKATQSTAWDGEATVAAEPKSGKTGVEVDYAGGSAFLLEEVPNGLNWIIATNENTDGVLSGVTLADVPPDGPIVAPVISLDTVGAIADTLVGAPQIDEGSAHILLRLARDGAALGGATVDAATVPGAVLAYDNGDDGAYTNDVDTTADFGTVLILNVVPPAGGKTLVDVIDSDNERFSLEVRIFPNAMAVIGYDLPASRP